MAEDISSVFPPTAVLPSTPRPLSSAPRPRSLPWSLLSVWAKANGIKHEEAEGIPRPCSYGNALRLLPAHVTAIALSAHLGRALPQNFAPSSQKPSVCLANHLFLKTAFCNPLGRLWAQNPQVKPPPFHRTAPRPYQMYTEHPTRSSSASTAGCEGSPPEKISFTQVRNTGIIRHPMFGNIYGSPTQKSTSRLPGCLVKEQPPRRLRHPIHSPHQ